MTDWNVRVSVLSDVDGERRYELKDGQMVQTAGLVEEYAVACGLAPSERRRFVGANPVVVAPVVDVSQEAEDMFAVRCARAKNVMDMSASLHFALRNEYIPEGNPRRILVSKFATLASQGLSVFEVKGILSTDSTRELRPAVEDVFRHVGGHTRASFTPRAVGKVPDVFFGVPGREDYAPEKGQYVITFHDGCLDPTDETSLIFGSKLHGGDYAYPSSERLALAGFQLEDTVMVVQETCKKEIYRVLVSKLAPIKIVVARSVSNVKSMVPVVPWDYTPWEADVHFSTLAPPAQEGGVSAMGACTVRVRVKTPMDLSGVVFCQGADEIGWSGTGVAVYQCVNCKNQLGEAGSNFRPRMAGTSHGPRYIVPWKSVDHAVRLEILKDFRNNLPWLREANGRVLVNRFVSAFERVNREIQVPDPPDGGISPLEG